MESFLIKGIKSNKHLLIKIMKDDLKIIFKVTSILIIIISYLSSICFSEEKWKKYPYSAPGGLITFPRDEGSHEDEKMEWWYFNLHLTGKSSSKSYGLWAGYYYTYNTRFIAFADNTNNTFISEVAVGFTTSKPGKLELKHKSRYGTDEWYQIDNKPFTYILKVFFKEVQVNLEMDLQKPPLVLNNNGLIHFNPTEYTYYFSLTNMKVSGTIKVGNFVEEVEGIGWEDHQWGNFSLQAISMGYGHEWFSIQAVSEDNKNSIDIVFYQLFTPDYKITNPMFSLINSDNSFFSTTDFTIERLAFWKSPSEEYYSNRWRLIEKSNQIDLVITPFQDNQLLYPPAFAPFREGPCYVEGKIKGKSSKGTAYAEGFKRYKPPIFSINYPNGGETLKGKVKITWQEPSDEAMKNLKYSVYYSQDKGKTFNLLTSNLSKTEFYWDTVQVTNGDNYMIKVEGTTLDGLLSGFDISDKNFSIKN